MGIKAVVPSLKHNDRGTLQGARRFRTEVAVQIDRIKKRLLCIISR